VYGSFNDHKPCNTTKAVFSCMEAELVTVMALAVCVKEKHKVKVATVHSHSFRKLACPDGSTIISTQWHASTTW
jgi:L-gulonolactone oxidase